MPRIPDRWLDYSPAGTQICDTPFIALKCPLHDYFFADDIPPEKRFTVNDAKTLIPSLSMIIDLTFTCKYYDPKAFDQLGVVYNKLPCVGHEVPNLNVLKRFFWLVDEFLQNKPEGDVGLIGVHCTHGVNRTGFIICSYMISKLGYTYKNAIEEFNRARGHNIERQNYLKRLQLYESKPLRFIHNENDNNPKQDSDNGRRTKERVKPRHRNRIRFNNVNSEPREATSRMDHPYRRTNNEFFPNRYQHHFNPLTPRHMSHPNSMPTYSNYNNYRGRYFGRRDSNRNDFRNSNSYAIPPYQNVPCRNVLENQCQFADPRSPAQFSRHRRPTELSH